jgi:hypothetical protein
MDLLGPTRGAKRGYSVEHDVQGDLNRTGVVTILLAVLGALALCPLLFGGFAATSGYGGSYDLLIVILGSILFLGLISTGIMFWRTRHNPSARGVGRVIVGTLALAGVVVLLLVAAFIVFFVVCLVELSGMKRFH